VSTSKAAGPSLSPAALQQLAEFRYKIRQFLHFSEEAARQNGIEPQQHQLMLAIKGLPQELRPTVTVLSSRLCLRHHSTVELIDRLVERGAVTRRHGDQDRREVLVEITPHGEELLRRLSVLHWQELQTSGPALSDALHAIVHYRTRNRRRLA
jgi:DNA-binding MarR family transcriptional regulator